MEVVCMCMKNMGVASVKGKLSEEKRMEQKRGVYKDELYCPATIGKEAIEYE